MSDSGSRPPILGFKRLRSLLYLALGVLVVRSCVISPYHVPTASMEPTIKVNDRLLAFKLAYSLRIPWIEFNLIRWSSPKRGDIVVFQYPKDPAISYVKRVVAVAGDEIRISERVLEVNGEIQQQEPVLDRQDLLTDIESPEGKELVRESFGSALGSHFLLLANTGSNVSPLNANFPVDGSLFKVPKNSVFVLGDNRDGSKDSRDWGHVPLDYIKAKAFLVLWGFYDPRSGGLFSLRLRRVFHLLQ